MVTISPCLDMAMDKKFCNYMKEGAECISQIFDPFFVFKQKILLS